MKKIFTLIMVASMFGLVACGPSAEETAADKAEAEAMVNEMFDAEEDAMGEKVEEHAEEGEEHVHAEGEEHSH